MAEAGDDEAQLLARAVAGERAAFAGLVQAHQAYLRQFLRRLTRGQQDWADELAQEAFIAAWRGLPGFRGEARFRSWLTRLAFNAYLRQRETQAPVEAVDEPPEAADSDFAPKLAQRLDLARALAQLREPEREAILMCFYAELSHAEAAEALGWPLGTLKTQVLRGRARLRELLEGGGR